MWRTPPPARVLLGVLAALLLPGGAHAAGAAAVGPAPDSVLRSGADGPGAAGVRPAATPGAARPSDRGEGILVLAAASLADVLPRVAALWESRGGVPVRFSFDATSRLAPQIARGAPADLFFSADRAWTEWVAARGGLREGPPVEVLSNELVAVVPAGAQWVPRGPAELAGEGWGRLALAGENVPAGRYARAALEAAGVWSAVAPRVVRGGSVRGALEWVARGEADVGIVYRTDARVEPRVRVAFAFPREGGVRIVYTAAVLAAARLPREAERFLEFCRSEAARELFLEAGFSLPSAGDGAGVPSVSFPNPVAAVRLSLIVAFAATLAGFVPAVALGWLLARRDFPGKTALATVLLVPLVLPPVVTGFLLLSVLGTRSALGGWLAALGLPVPFTLVGATLAALVVGMPLYIVSVRNAFQTVDVRYEEVSLSLGMPPLRTFRRVTLPLALPGIAAGAVLAFARALGEFGATVVLAGNVEARTRTIALAVYTLLESPGGRRPIWILVGASVALSLGALLGYEALSRRQRRRMEEHRGR